MRNLPEGYQDCTIAEAMKHYYEMRETKYSKTTWSAIQGQLERMRCYMVKDVGPNPRLSEVTEDKMTRYFNTLRFDLAPASFNNYRQYARQFFAHCRSRKWIADDPMIYVDPAKPRKRVRLKLSAAEMRQCLDGASPRDRIAMAIAMNTALRAGDVVGLTVGSANLTNGVLTAWIEKQDCDLEIPMTPALIAELRRWFTHYATAQGVTVEKLPNNWLIVPPEHFQGFDVSKPELGGHVVYEPRGNKGKPLAHPELIVQRALARLGHETKGEGFHTLRRSALTALYEHAVAKGIADPISLPQALANHAKRSTTEIYLGITHQKQVLNDTLRASSFLADVEDEDRRRTDGDDLGLRGA